MNTTTNETTVPAAKLETETCTRCAGSGSYSYCQSYGSKCFKCAGRKITYTKRGAAAARHLEFLRSKRIDALVPGDRVWSSGVPGFIAGSWYTVTAVRPTTSTYGASINGVPVAVRTDLLDVDGEEKGKSYGLNCAAPETIVRVGQNAEQKAATYAAAVAYQATLTKAGKPRVVRGA